jgi:hypothetical protein
MSENTNQIRRWEDLAAEEQTRIMVEYGYYLDTLPKTCSLDTKIERLRHWLKTEKNILYE